MHVVGRHRAGRADEEDGVNDRLQRLPRARGGSFQFGEVVDLTIHSARAKDRNGGRISTIPHVVVEYILLCPDKNVIVPVFSLPTTQVQKTLNVSPCWSDLRVTLATLQTRTLEQGKRSQNRPGKEK